MVKGGKLYSTCIEANLSCGFFSSAIFTACRSEAARPLALVELELLSKATAQLWQPGRT